MVKQKDLNVFIQVKPVSTGCADLMPPPAICIVALFSVDLAYGYHPISPYAYCAGNLIKYVDPDGKDIAILIASKGAGGRGHMGAVIHNKTGNYFM